MVVVGLNFILKVLVLDLVCIVVWIVEVYFYDVDIEFLKFGVLVVEFVIFGCLVRGLSEGEELYDGWVF